MTLTAEEDDAEASRADALLDGFEHLLRNDKFDAVDALLVCLNVEAMFPSEVLVILTITFHGKEKLVSRPIFVSRAEKWLTENFGTERAEALMKERR